MLYRSGCPMCNALDIVGDKWSLIVIRDYKGNLYFDYRDDTDISKLNESERFYTLPKCIYHNYKGIN